MSFTLNGLSVRWPCTLPNATDNSTLSLTIRFLNRMVCRVKTRPTSKAWPSWPARGSIHCYAHHQDPRMPTTQAHDAVKQIVDAFTEVSLGNGVSLREADVIDHYGTDHERIAARKQDELQDWQRIPDEDIENHSSVLCFMDDEGLRFHLPAYMRFTLRRYRDSESMSIDSSLYRLCDPDCIKRLLPYLTGQQIDAIKTFLNTCLEIGDDWLNISEVQLALRHWQGDEAAAEELRAMLDAVDEQQRVLRLILDASGKCDLGGCQPKPALWSRALLVIACVTPFVAFGILMFMRLRHEGLWWIVGVGAIAIAFVAFVLEMRRQTDGT